MAGYVIGVDFSKTKANAGVFNFCGEMIFQYVAPIHGRAYLDGLYAVSYTHLDVYKRQLFLFIDYNIGSVSVTPGFVGYLLFWAGMGEVECPTLTRVRPLTLAMAGASALIWVRSFFTGAFDVVGLLLMVRCV